MDFKRIGFDDVAWIHLVYAVEKCVAFVNMLMKFRIS